MKDSRERRYRRKKYKLITLLAAAGLCLTAGCGSQPKLPETPVVFQRGDGDGYVYLVEGDKIYVPYCAYDPKQLGECIGYCDVEDTDNSGAFREYIYELKGYSSDEWIVGVMIAGYFREGMILRERNTTEIPEGLTSEYEWNQ